MKTLFACGLWAVLIAPVTLADEIAPPNYSTPPLEFTNTHQIALRWDNDRLVTVTDTLLIGDETDTKATIYVKTIGNNHHMCNVAGEARKEGNQYVYRYQDCKLRIKVDSKQAKVMDVDGKCKRYFCGMMGYLDTELERK